jgi:M6 family metalloprotease-like protein
MIKLSLVLFIFLFLGCNDQIKTDQFTPDSIESPATQFTQLKISVAIPQKKAQAFAKQLHKPLGDFNDIEQVVLNVTNDSGELLAQNIELNYIDSSYQGEIPNLPLNERLNITATAQNSNALTIFRGSTPTVLVDTNSNAVSILMHVIDDGEDITIPRLTKVILDESQIHFYIDDNGSTDTLDYSIVSGDEQVEFVQWSDTVTLVDGAYVLHVDYNNSAYGSFNHVFTVENSLGGKLSTGFITNFVDSDGDANFSVSLAPVIQAIHIVRLGDELYVDVNASDDSNDSTLEYEYQFESIIDAGLEQRFIDPLVNPALMSVYNPNVMGYIHVKVTDNTEASSNATFLVRQNQFPDFTPPNLVSLSPDIDENGVAIESLIHISFDEKVTNFTTQTVLIDNDIAFNITTIDNKSYTLTPTTPLQHNTTYRVTMTKSIQDLSENSFIGFNYQFSTLDNSSDDNEAPIPTFSLLNIDKNSMTQTALSAIDNDGDTLTFSEVSPPLHGTLQLTSNGSFTYTPQSDYVGSDNFKYKVNDGKVDSYHQKVVIGIGTDDVKSIPTLLIRIEYNDQIFTHSEAVWANKVFGNEMGELNHYYKSVSYDNFSLQSAIESSNSEDDGVITIALNKTHPGNENLRILADLSNALTATNDFVNFAQFDTDENAIVSSDELLLMFVISGGESSLGDEPGIWAHTWCFDHNVNAFNAPLLDGVILAKCGEANYVRFGERHGNHDATVGVMAHEVAHAVHNLPDLYDPTANSAGIGYFGLMGHGAWSKTTRDDYSGATPTHLSAYAKNLLGWGTVVEFLQNEEDEEIQNYLFNDTSTALYNMVKISIEGENEYYLLENRSINGYDSGLESLLGQHKGGLALWKIDEEQEDNSKVNHKRVDLVEANGVNLDNGNHLGHTNNLFYNPHKKEYEDETTNLTITNISKRAEIMSANISK